MHELLNELELTNTGVEVGVLNGDYSEYLLNYWHGKILFLVDPWYDQKNYRDSLLCDRKTGNERLKTTINKLSPFQGRFDIVRDHSPDAASRFTDESLDWVFIDGNHSYQAVKADIRAWLPKVIHGGILWGHDYNNALSTPEGYIYEYVKEPPKNPETLTSFGVKAAVDEFVHENGYELFVTTDDPPAPTWYFRKP